MKKIMIEESLYEFAKRGRPKKRGRKRVVAKRGIGAPDTWSSKAGEDDEEGTIEDIKDLDVDVSDMTDVEEIEIDEKDVFDDKLFKALSNEVKLLEPNRRVVKFRLKGDLRKSIYGIPMLKIGKNAFIFKLKDGSLKKIFLRDMILEQEKRSNRAKMVSEFFSEIKGHDNHGTITNVDDNWRDNEQHKYGIKSKVDYDYFDDYCTCDNSDNIGANGKCTICGGWFKSEDEDQDYRKNKFNL